MIKFPRDKTIPARCPFCQGEIARPAPEDDGLWYEFDGGACQCGAYYALDPTARNGGAVMLQAMVQACGGDWDKALSLSPGVDYEEGFVGQYNSHTHRVGGNAFGTLYFIRRHRQRDSEP